MGRSRGTLGAVLAVLLLVVGGRSPVAAESVLWTLVASPLAVTTGSLTTFSLVATNEDLLASTLSSSEIGCVVVTVPANFDVRGAAVQSATTGATWSASRSGNVVTVKTSSGGDRLEWLDSVRFTVTAMPMSTGSIAWQSRAYSDHSCGGSGALLGVPPIVVVSGPAVTPTPSPTPVPTPVPTPPTPTASPSPTRPPGASATATPTARPVETTAPSPSPTPASGRTSPSPSPRTDDGVRPDATATPVPGATSPPDDVLSPASTPRVPGASDEPLIAPINLDGPGGSEALHSRPLAPSAADDPARSRPARLSLGPLSFLGTLDVWIVPGLLYGVPGILLIVFILLQGAGAAAWLPAIRRLGGSDT